METPSPWRSEPRALGLPLQGPRPASGRRLTTNSRPTGSSSARLLHQAPDGHAFWGKLLGDAVVHGHAPAGRGYILRKVLDLKVVRHVSTLDLQRDHTGKTEVENHREWLLIADPVGVERGRLLRSAQPCVTDNVDLFCSRGRLGGDAHAPCGNGIESNCQRASTVQQLRSLLDEVDETIAGHVQR